jgi:monofunctional biosynthetic peptidoglycan transglycosylase
MARQAAEVWRLIRQRPVELALPGAVLAAVFLIGCVVVPYPWGLSFRNPERTSLMEQRIGEGLKAGDTLEIVHDWMPLDEISGSLVRAVIVAEDHRFREHRGIDWRSLAEEVRWFGDNEFSWLSPSDLKALAGAVTYVWSHRRELRGRSTITQQLAKNLYFGTDRSLIRKAVELVVARRLERELSKDRILELYLNVAEWGPGLFGAEAAARAYFGRPASSLTLEQAAALAATLPHPLTSNPARNSGRMLWRRDLILQRLRPAAGVPPEPMPLPELDLPEPELPPFEDIGAPLADTAPPDSVGARPDTVSSRPDTTWAPH